MQLIGFKPTTHNNNIFSSFCFGNDLVTNFIFYSLHQGCLQILKKQPPEGSYCFFSSFFSINDKKINAEIKKTSLQISPYKFKMQN